MDLPHTDRTGLHAQSFGAESHAGCGFVENPADTAMFGRSGQFKLASGYVATSQCNSPFFALYVLGDDGAAAESNP